MQVKVNRVRKELSADEMHLGNSIYIGLRLHDIHIMLDFL